MFELGHAALARSLAILGLEESGKAIAVHNRRIEIVDVPYGEQFRCGRLDELWGDHTRKLETVYDFLVEERYWFGVEPADPEQNAAVLGTIQRWKRHDNLKQRGFYVDLGRTGDPIKPRDVASEESFREVVSRVHQVGWQLRLGEHIEGKRQIEEEEGSPAWDPDSPENDWMDPEVKEVFGPARPAQQGPPPRNAAYRFVLPTNNENPFRNVGKPGYEAESRELLALAAQLRMAQEDEPEDEEPADPVRGRATPRRRAPVRGHPGRDPSALGDQHPRVRGPRRAPE